LPNFIEPLASTIRHRRRSASASEFLDVVAAGCGPHAPVEAAGVIARHILAILRVLDGYDPRTGPAMLAWNTADHGVPRVQWECEQTREDGGVEEMAGVDTRRKVLSSQCLVRSSGRGMVCGSKLGTEN